jgi:hypothetical protein
MLELLLRIPVSVVAKAVPSKSRAISRGAASSRRVQRAALQDGRAQQLGERGVSQVGGRRDAHVPDLRPRAGEPARGIGELGAAVEAEVHVRGVRRHVAEGLLQALAERVRARHRVEGVVDELVRARRRGEHRLSRREEELRDLRVVGGEEAAQRGGCGAAHRGWTRSQRLP